MHTLSRSVDDEVAYRDHERTVLAMLATRYPDLPADGRRDLYQEAWASVLRRRRDGVHIEHLRSYLLGAADKLASKRVYGADARRRQSFDPTSEGFVALVGSTEPPDDRVLAEDEARRLHLLILELDQAEQALLKLRLDLGLDPHEVRERLGLSDRQYRRLAERAGKALLAQFRAFDRGDWARGKRSLLCACVMGIASEKQRQRAQSLVEGDPYCRAMMNELRELGGSAAAMLPVPVGAVAAGSGHGGATERVFEALASVKGRASELVDAGSGARGAKSTAADALSRMRSHTGENFIATKRHVGDVAAGAKQHLANAYMRAADPTPLAGARPGAAVALVASCMAVGGGAYCAVEGVPGPLRPAIGIERSQAGAAPKPRESKPDPPSSTPAPPVLSPAPAGPEARPPEQSTPSQAPSQPISPPVSPQPEQAPAPAPQPEDEFAPAAQPASPAEDSSAAAPSAPAKPAPTAGGSGEFAP